MKDWMKELNIEVTQDQERWLKALHRKISNGKEVSYRILRAELHKEIAEDFDPDSIDKRLANSRGTELTILGYEYLEPSRKLLIKTDQVILAIKELLLDDPTADSVNIDQLHAKTNIDPKELDTILRFVSRFREPSFANGSSGNSTYRFFSLRIGEEVIFDNFLKYKSLDDVIEAWIRKEEEYNTPKAVPKNKKTRILKGINAGIFGQQYFVEEEDNHDEKEGIFCKPIFRSPIPNVDKNLCFVLMPFKMVWSDEVYKELIRPNVERLGLQCLRADILTGMNVIEDVWTKINQCAFIIADVTSTNPNVMYEMGIVHTIGKPTILLTQDINNIPFDVLHLRHHPYQNSLTGAKEFKTMLERQIRAIYEEYYPTVQLKVD